MMTWVLTGSILTLMAWYS